MSRRRWVYRDGEAHEVELDYWPEPRSEVHIMRDIQPYQSMADGTWVTSRSSHREMLKRNNAVEIGNDPVVTQARPKPLQSPPGLKETLIMAAHKHNIRGS